MEDVATIDALKRFAHCGQLPRRRIPFNAWERENTPTVSEPRVT
jgi:hypothetical protein